MNVILNAPDDYRLTPEICQHSTEVAMQFLPEGVISQKGSAICTRIFASDCDMKT